MPRVHVAIRRTLPTAAALAVLGLAAGAGAQSLALATDRPGTMMNAVGSGVAKVVSAPGRLNVAVRPYAGPTAWMPLLDGGEVQLGVLSSNSAWQAFNGAGEVKQPMRNMRLLRSGTGSLFLGFIVAAKSPIRTVQDLKGRRVSSDFGGHVSIPSSIAATLATAGLKWSDVTPVPVVGANDGVEALVAGRLDASWASLGMPQVREAHAKIGIRYLSLPNSPEALATWRKITF